MIWISKGGWGITVYKNCIWYQRSADKYLSSFYLIQIPNAVPWILQRTYVIQKETQKYSNVIFDHRTHQSARLSCLNCENKTYFDDIYLPPLIIIFYEF